VFLTSLVASAELTTLGDDKFLAKPVEPQLLIRTINSMLPAIAA
jgi:hypothetical protein